MAFRYQLLIIITIIGAFFRFWDMGKIPQSLNWDEIAIGYNAYSILKTGKDEFGTFLPTTFRSFEDYKSPTYIYLTVPAIALFGKTEFAIRFASAFFGTLTIPMLYLCSLYLLAPFTKPSPETIFWRNRIKNISIIAAFLLAVTPWHIHFSRVAFEANVGLFFIVSATYFFLKWLHHDAHQHKQMYVSLFAAVILYALAIHSYANMRLFVPLLLVGICIPVITKLLRRWKSILFAFILGLALISPLIIQMYRGEGLSRFQATSIINRPYIYDRANVRFAQEVQVNNDLFGKIIYNPRWSILTAFFDSYFSHFTFDFLFQQNEPNRFNIPGNGLLYPWMLPLLVFGSIYLVQQRSHLNTSSSLWWLLVAPIPAGMTWETPNAIRTEVMLIPLTILTAVGLWRFLKLLQHLDIQFYRAQLSQPMRPLYWLFPKTIAVILMTVVFFSILRMWSNYTHHLNLEYADVWLCGRKEMVAEVQKIKHEFKEVRIALSLEWSYLWFLWYGNIEPAEYLQMGGTKSGGFAFEGNEIGNLKFKNFDYAKESFNNSGILFIGSPTDFPDSLVPGQVIENTERQKFIYIVRS